MKIIALDSSGMTASVAVLEDDKILAEYTTNYKKTHSQTLLPMLDRVKNDLQLDLKTVDAIAISAGPGSFTGLRIGSATAKGLGLALNKPLVSVPTLGAMAYNFYGSSAYICPMMDARRNQTYTGIYKFLDGKLVEILGECAIAVEDLIEKVNELDGEIIFLGDGVPVFREQLESKCSVTHTYAPSHLALQRTASVAEYAKQLFLDGKIESAADHRPEYLRVSQAERERAEKESN